jgi:acid phosphatase family membrane protein YuiD
MFFYCEWVLYFLHLLNNLSLQVLNLIVEDLFKGHPVSEKKLKELLGHTPLQVFAGACLGVLVGYLCSHSCLVAL